MSEAGVENNMIKWVWFTVAVITGYVIVILGTSVIWFLLPGKGSLQDSSFWELILGNIFIVAVGYLAGAVAEGISKRKNFSTSILISLFIVTETMLFISQGNHVDPVWFVSLEAIIIILSTAYGNYFMAQRRS